MEISKEFSKDKMLYEEGFPEAESSFVNMENSNRLLGKDNCNENISRINTEEHKAVVKDALKSSCLNIFLNFARFSAEEMEFYLPFQSVVKIMKTVNLIGNKNLKSCEIDLMLKKANPKGQKLNADQFMNFIVFLTNKLDHSGFELEPRVAVARTIQTYLDPLCSYIDEQNLESTQNGSGTVLFLHKYISGKLADTEFDEKIISILNKIYEGIKHVYCCYFHFEMSPVPDVNKILTGSLTGLIEFCKDFDLIPYLISIDKVAIFYTLILEMSQEDITKKGLIYDGRLEVGCQFLISKFSAFLVHLAFVYHEKFGEKSLNLSKLTINDDSYLEDVKNFGDSERLLMFCEKLESGKGFENMKKRCEKTSMSKLTLLPPFEVIESVTFTLKNRLVLILQDYLN